jgi:hypothetical protein
MASINQFADRLKSLSIINESRTALEDNKPLIKDLNRERMLEGRKTDGNFLPNYSRTSQVVYGYPNEPIKLKDTGAFQSAITVEIEQEKIITGSSDDKTGMLVERYGDNIFGLGTQDKVELIVPLRKSLVGNIKKKLGL